ncbi:hypothetical protein MiAbW_01111 [Microcystis aeruginosa NIES-4325]|uniref:Uncharacterized protein n=1 Tax=Microcystis aeruginosa NIES-4325 TaxID=2569534 RepID=A0A5J4F7I5_MICAE|nr:hypothetical protein [Microcystis aeruginosa]GEA26558.1 hypothetical protein MiAbW_01111 [Microcystis aeruginosa NIES-4325]
MLQVYLDSPNVRSLTAETYRHEKLFQPTLYRSAQSLSPLCLCGYFHSLAYLSPGQLFSLILLNSKINGGTLIDRRTAMVKF